MKEPCGKMKVNCLHSCIMVEKFYLYRVKLTNTPHYEKNFLFTFPCLIRLFF